MRPNRLRQIWQEGGAAVNGWLLDRGLLAIASSPVVGLVVETGCTYFESVAFPDPLDAGIAVARLGRSSVRYRLGIFRRGGALAVAQGHFVHVYVERARQDRAVPLPAALRDAAQRLLMPVGQS